MIECVYATPSEIYVYSIIPDHQSGSIVSVSRSARAARYGTPASYKLQGDYMQLRYGSYAAGCRLIVLIDQGQRVDGWASAGKSCATP